MIVEGADHFFTGKLDRVAAAIDAWLAEMFPATAAQED
jgi:alpha/beta superfamily hydrolase